MLSFLKHIVLRHRGAFNKTRLFNNITCQRELTLDIISSALQLILLLKTIINSVLNDSNIFYQSRNLMLVNDRVQVRIA